MPCQNHYEILKYYNIWGRGGRWLRRWRFGAGEASGGLGLEGRRWRFSRVKAPGRLELEGPVAAPMAVFGKSRCRVAFGGSRDSEALAIWDWRGRWPFSRVKAPGRLRPSAAPMAVWGWRGRWPFWGRGAKKKRRRRPVACAPKSNHKFPEL